MIAKGFSQSILFDNTTKIGCWRLLICILHVVFGDLHRHEGVRVLHATDACEIYPSLSRN